MNGARVEDMCSTLICLASLGHTAEFAFFFQILREGCHFIQINQVQRPRRDPTRRAQCFEEFLRWQSSDGEVNV